MTNQANRTGAPATAALLVGVALVPAAVLTLILLLQAGALSIGGAPTPKELSSASHPRLAQLLGDLTSRVNAERSDRSAALTIGWVGVVALLAIGAGLAAALWRRIAASPRPDPMPDDVPGALRELTDDRERLLEACIELGDQVASHGLKDELRLVLHDVGLEELTPAEHGRFDPSRHRAVGRVPTEDAALHNRIAALERAGYSDRGRQLRPAEVLVYHHQPRDDG